jgi:hypothetical protein
MKIAVRKKQNPVLAMLKDYGIILSAGFCRHRIHWKVCRKNSKPAPHAF